MIKNYPKFTPRPWYWGDGWKDSDNWEKPEDRPKYADMQLYGGNGLEIIPIRIDHREAEWDTPIDCCMPSYENRCLIKMAPDLYWALDECVFQLEASIQFNEDDLDEEALKELNTLCKEAKEIMAKARGEDNG